MQRTETHENRLIETQGLFTGLDDQQAICEENIASIEEQLHVAQANKALLMVWRQLQICVVAYQYKSRSIASQWSYTQSRDLKQAIEFQILLAQHQYCAACNVLLSLHGPGEWEHVMQELQPEDIRGLNKQVLTAEEDQIHQWTREMAGVSGEMSEEELLLGNIPTALFDACQVGDRSRALS